MLVVGASASGVQIADELRRAGRDGHDRRRASTSGCRVPYRGRDIYWWLDRIGQLDERYDEVDDIERARRHASVQLVGNDERRDLDLNALRAGGVRVVGRLMAVARHHGAVLGRAREPRDERRPQADPPAAPHRRVRGRPRPGDEVGPADGARHPRDSATAPTELDLTAFSTVIWATGYRPTYSWLDARRVRPAAAG